MQTELISPNNSHLNFSRITNEMENLFGDQSHIRADVIEKVYSIDHNLVYSGSEGHLVILPLNHIGYEKILNPNLEEEDLNIYDLASSQNGEEVYFFVYSIFGKTPHDAFFLVDLTRKSVERFAILNNISRSSKIFAECVTKQGARLCKRLGMMNSHVYRYRDELINIYQTGYLRFLAVAGNTVSRTSKFS